MNDVAAAKVDEHGVPAFGCERCLSLRLHGLSGEPLFSARVLVALLLVLLRRLLRRLLLRLRLLVPLSVSESDGIRAIAVRVLPAVGRRRRRRWPKPGFLRGGLFGSSVEEAEGFPSFCSPAAGGHTSLLALGRGAADSRPPLSPQGVDDVLTGSRRYRRCHHQGCLECRTGPTVHSTYDEKRASVNKCP